MTATIAPTAAPRSPARWAAAGYLAIFVLAIFANFLALGPVLQPGDAAATASALRDSADTVRLGAVAFLGIFVIDIVVAWALYLLFRPVHRDLALLSAWLRLAYTVVLGGALGFLYAALRLADSPTAFGGSQDHAILLELQTFDVTWVIGLAAFGLHLVVLAALMIRARGPRWIAWLLAAAGMAYVLDTIAHIALADYEAWSSVFLAIVGIPSVVGELSFTGWLLLVGSGRAQVGRAPVTGREVATDVQSRPAALRSR